MFYNGLLMLVGIERNKKIHKYYVILRLKNITCSSLNFPSLIALRTSHEVCVEINVMENLLYDNRTLYLIFYGIVNFESETQFQN